MEEGLVSCQLQWYLVPSRSQQTCETMVLQRWQTEGSWHWERASQLVTAWRLGGCELA